MNVILLYVNNMIIYLIFFYRASKYILGNLYICEYPCGNNLSENCLYGNWINWLKWRDTKIPSRIPSRFTPKSVHVHTTPTEQKYSISSAIRSYYNKFSFFLSCMCSVHVPDVYNNSFLKVSFIFLCLSLLCNRKSFLFH